MKSKGQKLDQWMAFHSVPRNLKKRIKEYHHCNWRDTKGFDVENLLHNLPKDIRRETVRHLCLDVLKKVPLLQNMDEKLSDAICDHLEIVYSVKQSLLVGEGDPLDEMFFITQGTLRTRTRNGGQSFLHEGSFYGEELVDWALSYSPSFENIPSSTKTGQAQTKVEAFVLTADDLKKIVSKSMSHFNLEQLEHRAASALQEAWRCYSRKKKPNAPSSTITEQQ